MARRKKEAMLDDNYRRPAITPEAQEKRNINLAARLAEKQLREGTASSQVITHYLKLGSPKEQTELEILQEQKKLISAKTEALKSATKIEELFSNAMAAFTEYEGTNTEDDG